MKLSKLRILSILILLILVTSLVFPSVAFAGDDPTAPQPTAEPVAVDPLVTEEPVAEEASVAEVVQVMADADAVLLDENGQPVPLATAEASEAIANADPYIVRGGVTYRFMPVGGCGVLPDCTESSTPIQTAINFSNAGEVINIEPGTYVEQLVVTKDVTLQATAAGVVIQAPNDIANCFTTSQQNQAIVCVKNTSNASIVGLTVDGLNSGNNDYRYTGIGFFNAGGTIQGNTVQHITDTPFSGTQHGNAIYAYNQDGTARTINVLDNTVFDYQKNGITMNGNGLTAIVDGNTVTGRGPTSVIAQNGIQIGFGATGEITNNEVSGHEYTGAGWSSAGVLLYDTNGTVLVEGNNIHDNQDGISLADSVADITDNTIASNDWGIAVVSNSAGSSNANITLNEILGNGVGIYSDNPNTRVNQNSIVGNGTGLEYDTYYKIQGTLDATGNWWGDSNGPSEGSISGCDPISDCARFTNWLTSNPFVGSQVVAVGSDLNTRSGLASPAVTPVTSGQQVFISCGEPSVTYVVEGIEVTFTGLCGYSALLETITEERLPGEVGAGNSFVAGISVTLMKDGKTVDTLPASAGIRISYSRPAGADADLFFWNGSSWDEIEYMETQTTVSGDLPGPGSIAMVTH